MWNNDNKIQKEESVMGPTWLASWLFRDAMFFSIGFIYLDAHNIKSNSSTGVTKI